jgi:hypothetical protein
VSRRQFDAWHQAFRRAAAGLFEALAAQDRAALAALVPDERLRQRLPPSLQAEPACDRPDAHHGVPRGDGRRRRAVVADVGERERALAASLRDPGATMRPLR